MRRCASHVHHRNLEMWHLGYKIRSIKTLSYYTQLVLGPGLHQAHYRVVCSGGLGYCSSRRNHVVASSWTTPRYTRPLTPSRCLWTTHKTACSLFHLDTKLWFLLHIHRFIAAQTPALTSLLLEPQKGTRAMDYI